MFVTNDGTPHGKVTRYAQWGASAPASYGTGGGGAQPRGHGEASSTSLDAPSSAASLRTLESSPPASSVPAGVAPGLAQADAPRAPPDAAETSNARPKIAFRRAVSRFNIASSMYLCA